MAEAGAIALRLADDGADALAVIEERAEKDSTGMLRAALAATLISLRRAYTRYREATQAPAAVTPAELTSRYQDVIRSAQRFLTGGELASWEASYRRHLEAAMAAAATTTEQLQRVEAPEQAPPPYGGPDPVAIEAQLQATGASLRAEGAGFREQLAAIVGAAAVAGLGLRKLEQQARFALEGIPDRRRGRGVGGRGPAGPAGGPGGAGRGPAAPGAPQPPAGGPAGGRSRQPPPRPQAGVIQRIAVTVRSGLQEAAGRVSTALVSAAGFEYVRWIATRDERTCAYCVARHGRIYRAGEVSVPAHRRCRCWLQPVSGDAVNDPDPSESDRRLGGAFWRRSQQQVWREYATSRGKGLTEARPEILKAANTPTAAEKRRSPGTTQTARPVRTLDGPGGRDLGTAVRDSNRQG